MILLALPLLLLLLFVGVALTLAGLRGRRVDDHPICRKCGFDLVGLPQGVSRCSECGADLTRLHAVRDGRRRRRPVMLGSGVAMLLIVVTAAGLAGLMVVRQVGVDRTKPTWLLVRETRDRSNSSAWVELSRRASAGSIPSSTASVLVERALAWQADAKVTWQPRWGDFVQDARDAKLVSDAQWQRYARQAPQLSLELRRQARKGDDLPAWIRSANARVGTRSRFSVRFTHPIDSGELTRAQSRQWGSGHSVLGLDPTGSAAIGHIVQLDKAASRSAAEAERDVRVSIELSVVEGSNEKSPPLATWKHDMHGKWALVAADANTVERIEDESLRPAVEQALSAPRVIHQRWSGQESLRVDLRCDKSPVPLSYEAFARDPRSGKEWKLSTATFSGGGTIHSGVGGSVKGFDAKQIDLLLRPSEEAARNTTAITRMWTGEVVIKGLAVMKDSSWEK